MRSHSAVRAENGNDERDDAPGELTSGSYAPTLSRSIGLARVPAAWDAERVEVAIRDKWQPARVVRYPFVRHGKSRID